MDFKDYEFYKSKIKLSGFLIYEPNNCFKNNNKIFCKNYKIYSTDEEGDFFKDLSGNIYFISN